MSRVEAGAGVGKRRSAQKLVTLTQRGRGFKWSSVLQSANIIRFEGHALTALAGHSNAKTTGLYDRRNDDIRVGEVEKWDLKVT
jgi:hypothetical protein